MNPTECPCKKKNCERHGNCEACRAYHASSKRQRPCACEKEKRRFQLFFRSDRNSPKE